MQLLLGHTKLESTVRYLGVEVDDALEIAEQIEVCAIHYCDRILSVTSESFVFSLCSNFRHLNVQNAEDKELMTNDDFGSYNHHSTDCKV